MHFRHQMQIFTKELDRILPTLEEPLSLGMMELLKLITISFARFLRRKTFSGTESVVTSIAKILIDNDFV